MTSPLCLVEDCSPLLLGSFQAQTMDPSSSLLMDFTTFQNEYGSCDSPKTIQFAVSSPPNDQEEDSNSTSSSGEESFGRLTLGKNVKLSRSLPFFKITPIVDYSKEKYPYIEETSYADIYPKCHYDAELHEAQIQLAKKVPQFEYVQSIFYIAAKKYLSFLTDDFADLKKTFQLAISENNLFHLIPAHDQIIASSSKMAEDSQTWEIVAPHLKKLINFTSCFNVTNFSVRDAAFVAQFVSYSCPPENREFFTQLADVLKCDFIEKSLLTKLREALVHVNEKTALLLRWILDNLNEGQIITKGEHRASMSFTLSIPKTLDTESEKPDAFSTLNPKKYIKLIIDQSSRASAIIRRNRTNEAAGKWQNYFDQITTCFKRILDDCTPQKVIKAGPLFGKTIATLTKFGPQSNKFAPQLPEIVSTIVDNCSTIDEIIGHSRSQYILQSNIESSLTNLFITIRDKLMPPQKPSLLAKDMAILWNVIKLAAFVENPEATVSSINSLSHYVRSIAQVSQPLFAHNIACISFQFSNADPTLTNVQKSFIEAQTAMSALSSALQRSAKKMHDPQQKKFVVQWYNYCENLVECLRALSKERNPMKQIADIYNVLEQLKNKAKKINIVRETESARQAIKKLYKIVVDERRKAVAVV